MARSRIRGVSLRTWFLTGALAAASAHGGEGDGFFPFPLPWGGPVEGSAVDMAHLNAAPAGKNGRIVARGEHFVESGTGQRIRFLSMNLCGGEILSADPERYRPMIRRLAAAGFNLVRIHHFDNTFAFWRNGSLFQSKRPDDATVLDPVQVDKLYRIVALCKEYGVYIDMNLKVSRRLGAADGMPPEIKDVKTNHQKALDVFHPLWRAKQKEFARDILATRNPHTGLSMAEDPAVAFVEINNEDSIAGTGWESQPALTVLPEVFRIELDRQWTAWLRARHGDDDALRAAWNVAAAAPGADLIVPAQAWKPEAHAGVTLNLARPANLPADFPDEAQPGEAPPVRIDVAAVADAAWKAQAMIDGLTMENGKLYTLSFKARSDVGRWATVGVRRGEAPWDYHGLAKDFATGPAWKDFVYTFTAERDPAPGKARVTFTVGQRTGAVEIAALRLREGADGAGLREGESLAARIGQPGAVATPEQRRDWQQFLVDTEKEYAADMTAFLRNDLGVGALIAAGQVDFTGLLGFEREEASDYADSHGYWEHPQFPKGWSDQNWSIPNASQVAVLDKGQGPLIRLAHYRVAGRPFSVSEYDHCAPSDYSSEMYPLMALAASRQDWDALHVFCHGEIAPDDQTTRLVRWFDQTAHPGKIGFAPATALLWRRNAVDPAAESWTLRFPRPFHRYAHLLHVPWQLNWTGGPLPLFDRRLAQSYEAADPAVVEKRRDADPRDRVSMVDTPSGRAVIASADTVAAAVGFVGGGDFELGDARLMFDQSLPHASALWVSLDGRPLAESKRMLLTVMGRAENTGMHWDEKRKTLSGRWGASPVRVQGAVGRAALSVKDRAAGRPRVYALDPDGTRRMPVASQWLNDSNGRATLSFPFTPASHTIWYEIAVE